MTSGLTLEDLAKQSGLSIRTLRYYIQEGLLPGPETRGKYASYSQLHLEQLELVQLLKARYLPLDHIRQLLENLTPGDIRRMLERQESVSPGNEEKIIQNLDDPQSPIAGSSALEYIRSLEQSHEIIEEMHPSYSPQSFKTKPGVEEKLNNVASRRIHIKTTQEESWQRIELTKGVELHIRNAKENKHTTEIQALIDFARDLFEI